MQGTMTMFKTFRQGRSFPLTEYIRKISVKAVPEGSSLECLLLELYS